MEKHKQTLYTLLVGMCIGVVIILAVLVLSNNVPWLRAAGVGTGAPDVNARYLDGYGTSLSAGASKIYISDGSNYLPDNTVDSGAIMDGTIVSADISTDTIEAGDIKAGAVGTSEIADGTVVAGDISDGACLSEILDDDGAGSSLDADLLDGQQGSYYMNPTVCTTVCAYCNTVNCYANASCPAGYVRVSPCMANFRNYTGSNSCANHQIGGRSYDYWYEGTYEVDGRIHLGVNFCNVKGNYNTDPTNMSRAAVVMIRCCKGD